MIDKIDLNLAFEAGWEACEEFMINQLKGGINKMGTIGEEAKEYEPPQTLNIADLEVVRVDEVLEDDEFTYEDKEDEGKEKTVRQKVLVRDGEKYRVPASVLKNLKAILEKKPDLKAFQVLRSGEGIKTSYTVMPL